MRQFIGVGSFNEIQLSPFVAESQPGRQLVRGSMR